MTYIAFLICNSPERAFGLDDILAIGITKEDAVGLVMDAWHAYATEHRLDPDLAHEEDVAWISGVMPGDVFINRIKANQ